MSNDKPKGSALVAVAKDGGELEFASEELLADAELARIAVAENGWALKFASRELWADAELARIAVADYAPTEGETK